MKTRNLKPSQAQDIEIEINVEDTGFILSVDGTDFFIEYDLDGAEVEAKFGADVHTAWLERRLDQCLGPENKDFVPFGYTPVFAAPEQLLQDEQVAIQAVLTAESRGYDCSRIARVKALLGI